MSKERKLDIFQLLAAADLRQRDWLSKQPEDSRSAFAPIVVTRWAATVADGQEAACALWLVNERVNLHLFDLTRHPDLVYRLLASCGLGKKLRHEWLDGKRAATRPAKLNELIQEYHPEANDREIDMLIEQYDRTSFAEFVADTGKQPEEIKELLKAYDRYKPEETTKAAKAAAAKG